MRDQLAQMQDALTAGQLAFLLSRLPPDAVVMVPGYENGWDPLLPEEIKVKDVVPVVNARWYEGTLQPTTAGYPAIALGLAPGAAPTPTPPHNFVTLDPNWGLYWGGWMVECVKAPNVIEPGVLLRVNQQASPLRLEPFHQPGTPRYLRFADQVHVVPVDAAPFHQLNKGAEFLVSWRDGNTMELSHIPPANWNSRPI